MEAKKNKNNNLNKSNKYKFQIVLKGYGKNQMSKDALNKLYDKLNLSNNI